MNIGRFKSLLDRFGPDFTAWPARSADQARAFLSVSADARRVHGAMLRAEAALAASRPKADPARIARVVNSALREIAQLPPRLTLAEQFRQLAFAPFPRLAFFALTATAIGFGIGFYVGVPSTVQAAEVPSFPMVAASAGDGF